MYVVPLPFVVTVLALLLLFYQAARPEQTALQAPGNGSPQAPVNASPQAPSTNATPTTPDPAVALFAPTSSAGLLLVTVKADKTADYEDVIRALQDALSKSTDEQKRAIAKGWRVFKSDTDPKANAIYIHVINPAIANVDYRPSLLLDELLAGASSEMLGKYRDAIVSGPTKLGMNELANMAVAPVPKPSNASPDAPAPPKKPGG